MGFPYAERTWVLAVPWAVIPVLYTKSKGFTEKNLKSYSTSILRTEYRTIITITGIKEV
jgi:hypothetical protein